MSAPQPPWMDIAQTLSWIGAVVTALIGAIGFFITQHLSRRQRRTEIAQREEANRAAARELQWRQAGAAQISIDKLEGDVGAADAMLMLDWDGRRFPTDAKEQWRLRKRDVLKALRTRGKPFSPPETYVRDCFDRLFWHFERIHSQIEVDLITLRHIGFPLAYLVAMMDKNRTIFETFLKVYGYAGARALMDELRQQGLPNVDPNYEEIFDASQDEERDADDDDDFGGDDEENVSLSFPVRSVEPDPTS